MGLVDIVDNADITPGWAKDRPWWWSMFRLGAVLVDALIEGVFQGVRASMPNAIEGPGVEGWGGFEDPKSPEYIGHDLGVLRGLTESIPAYSFRLRHAHDPAAGGWEAPPMIQMLEQLAGVLGPTPPLMRLVNSAGDWWTRYSDGLYELATVAGHGYSFHPDGSTSALATAAHPWDWDSTTLPAPADKGYAGRWWLILYEPINAPYGTTGPYTFNSGAVLGHVWNDLRTYTTIDPNPEAATWGTNSPHKLVALLFGVIAQRQCAGFQCSHVIVSTDPSQFNPDGSSTLPAGALGTAYPDGHWGWDGKASGGNWIVSRNSTAIYWRLPTS